VNQGPRSRWLTGEIYVDEGLEDALNVDRDSFNRFHPEFRAVQEYVHTVLKTEVFPQVYKNIDKRSYKKAADRATNRKRLVSKVVASAFDRPVRVTVGARAAREEEPPQARLVEKAGRVDLVLPAETSIQAKKPQRQIVAAILGVFEVAMQERTTELRRTKFTELLIQLLEGW
jgi:hypothetical protein